MKGGYDGCVIRQPGGPCTCPRWRAERGLSRYEDLLASILTPQQMEAYAEYIRQTGEIRIFEEMSPGELAALPAPIAGVAAQVTADVLISMENRRVVALLDQRGELDVAPAEGEHSRRMGGTA